MDRLTAMRVFVQTVDSGSLSAAAESLDISRAMASRYLEGLEDWLGVRLLHRTTRKLSLSDAGEQALARCREMLALSDDFVAQASHGGAQAQGKLRVTTSPSFAQAQLAAAMVDFQVLHPQVEIDLQVGDRMVNLVEERIDLAVRISNRIDPLLVARRLAVCQSVLCASPAYLRRAGVPATPEELKQHRCVTHSSGIAPEYMLRRDGQLSKIQVGGALTVNETCITRAAAMAGAGIAMLPTFYAVEELARGTLVRVLPDYTLDPLDIQAVYLSRRHQPQPLRLLIEFLAERFGGAVAPWDRGEWAAPPATGGKAPRRRAAQAAP